MQIKKIHIDNFGKIYNFTVDFSDSINTMCYENGWGKSTMASFIKAMLYGLGDGRKKKLLDDSERQKFTPWNGTIMGGYIIFTIYNREYRLERTFGKKETDDTFKLYDNITGLLSDDYTIDIGTELFGLNKDAYSRTTFIPQNRINVVTNDSISAKLTDMAQSENDINNFEVALKKLNDYRKNYSLKRGKGMLDEKKDRIDELNTRKRNIGVVELEYEEFKKKLAECENEKLSISNELEVLRNEYNAASQYMANKEVLNNYDEICREQAEAESLLTSKKVFFSNIEPDREDIDSLLGYVAEYNEGKGELKSLIVSQEDYNELRRLDETNYNISREDYEETRDVISWINKSENELSIQKARIDEKKNTIVMAERNENARQREINESVSKKKRYWFCAIVIGLIIVAVGIATHILPLSIGGGVFFAIGLAMVLLHGNKSVQDNVSSQTDYLKSTRDELADMQDESEKLWSEIAERKRGVNEFLEGKGISFESGDLLTRLEIAKKTADSRLELRTAVDKFGNAENHYMEIKHNLLGIISKYGIELIDDYSALANNIKEQSVMYYQAKNDYLRIMEKKSKLEQLHDINNIRQQEKPKHAMLELQMMISETEKRLDEHKQKRTDLDRHIEELENRIFEKINIEQELFELEEQLQSGIEKLNIIDKTITSLEQSKNIFTSKYSSKLQQAFNKYMDMFVVEGALDIGDVKINSQLDVKVDDTGKLRDLEWYSAGSRDYIYICMRLALIDALYEDEKPFVVLDDPFVNLDDQRFEAVAATIKKIASRYQIIYLTCSENRVIK